MATLRGFELKESTTTDITKWKKKGDLLKARNASRGPLSDVKYSRMLSDTELTIAHYRFYDYGPNGKFEIIFKSKDQLGDLVKRCHDLHIPIDDFGYHCSLLSPSFGIGFIGLFTSNKRIVHQFFCLIDIVAGLSPGIKSEISQALGLEKINSTELKDTKSEAINSHKRFEFDSTEKSAISSDKDDYLSEEEIARIEKMKPFALEMRTSYLISPRLEFTMDNWPEQPNTFPKFLGRNSELEALFESKEPEKSVCSHGNAEKIMELITKRAENRNQDQAGKILEEIKGLIATADLYAQLTFYDPEIDLYDMGQFLLTSAVSMRDFEVVKLLIEHGADVNLSADHCDSPLIAALTVAKRNATDANKLNEITKIIKLLLDKGADPKKMHLTLVSSHDIDKLGLIDKCIFEMNSQKSTSAEIFKKLDLSTPAPIAAPAVTESDPEWTSVNKNEVEEVESDNDDQLVDIDWEHIQSENKPDESSEMVYKGVMKRHNFS